MYYGTGIMTVGTMCEQLGRGGGGTLGFSPFPLHGHVFREHIRDVVPWVAIETLLQPLLVQIVS